MYIEGLYDYSTSYNNLRYRYDHDYNVVIEERQKNFVKIDTLKSLSGDEFVYIETPLVRNILESIENNLNSLKIEKSGYDALSAMVSEGLYSSLIEGAMCDRKKAYDLATGKEEPKYKSDFMVYNNIMVLRGPRRYCGITEESVLEIWRSIVDNACDNESIIGTKYRSGDIMITNSLHSFPRAKDVQKYMNMLYFFITNADMHYILKSIVVHYYFVYVHPFCDGNGRTARFLMKSILDSGDKTDNMIKLFPSYHVYCHRYWYYDSLQNSEIETGNIFNDLTYFIEFYLEMLNRCLVDAK
jgi:Fic family protein